MRIAFTTVGCRLNQCETDALRGRATADGWEVVPFEDEADAYVINSCTITTEADADSRQLARRAVRRNPAALVVLAGCFAQGNPEAAAAVPGVDLILGNREKASLLDEIRRYRKNGSPRVRVGDIRAARHLDGEVCGPGLDPDRTRALLKIQDGCSYGCSFCIVPSVRGPNRSLPAAEALRALERLHVEGFAEVVLTGVHLGTYGRDLAPRTSLDQLCAEIAAMPAAPRVRLSSLDPHEVSPALVRLLAQSRRLCRHLHLPLQSGDEETLRRMRRGHSAAAFEQLVAQAAMAVPGIAVTADVIVGFPGEDPAAFRRTRDLLEALPVAGLHVFSYSQRPGTAAAAMSDQVPAAVKRERSRALRDLASRKADAFRRRHLGEILEAVVLRRSKSDGRWEGLSDNYLTVRFAGGEGLRGTVVPVRAEQTTAAGVAGSLVG